MTLPAPPALTGALPPPPHRICLPRVVVLEDLPDELLTAVASSATGRTIMSLTATSRRLRRAALSSITCVAISPFATYLNPPHATIERMFLEQSQEAPFWHSWVACGPRSAESGLSLGSFLRTTPALRRVHFHGWTLGGDIGPQLMPLFLTFPALPLRSLEVANPAAVAVATGVDRSNRWTRRRPPPNSKGPWPPWPLPQSLVKWRCAIHPWMPTPLGSDCCGRLPWPVLPRLRELDANGEWDIPYLTQLAAAYPHVTSLMLRGDIVQGAYAALALPAFPALLELNLEECPTMGAERKAEAGVMYAGRRFDVLVPSIDFNSVAWIGEVSTCGAMPRRLVLPRCHAINETPVAIHALLSNPPPELFRLTALRLWVSKDGEAALVALTSLPCLKALAVDVLPPSNLVRWPPIPHVSTLSLFFHRRNYRRPSGLGAKPDAWLAALGSVGGGGLGGGPERLTVAAQPPLSDDALDSIARLPRVTRAILVADAEGAAAKRAAREDFERTVGVALGGRERVRWVVPPFDCKTCSAEWSNLTWWDTNS